MPVIEEIDSKEPLQEADASVAQPSGTPTPWWQVNPNTMSPQELASLHHLVSRVQNTEAEQRRANWTMVPAAMGAGLFETPLLGAAASGLGQLATEGLDYLTAPREQQPGGLGVGLRAGAAAAMPLVFGGGAKALSPLLREAPEAPELLRPSPPPSKTAMSELGGNISNRVRAALPSGQKTIERRLKESLLAELHPQSPSMDVTGIIPNLRMQGEFAPVAKDAFNGMADSVEKLSGGTGRVPIIDMEHLLHDSARYAAPGSIEARVVQSFREEYNAAVESHIGEHFGQEMVDKLHSYNRAISAKLSTAEGLASELTKDPIAFVRKAATNTITQRALEAFDYIHGTDLLKKIQAFAAQQAEFESTKAAAQTGNAAAKKAYSVLLAQHTRQQAAARGLVAGLFALPGGLGGWMGALISGGVGATAAAKPVAYLAEQAAKVGPAATAMVNQLSKQISNEKSK